MNACEEGRHDWRLADAIVTSRCHTCGRVHFDSFANVVCRILVKTADGLPPTWSGERKTLTDTALALRVAEAVE